MVKKRKDLFVLKKIYEMSSVDNNNINVNELIHLVYSINPYGQKRKISLKEKLDAFNCSSNNNYSL